MKKWTPKEIRAYRKKRELSQRAFGESLGVVQNYIYLLERGARTPGKTLKILTYLKDRRNRKRKRKGGENKAWQRVSISGTNIIGYAMQGLTAGLFMNHQRAISLRMQKP